jgi:uncharacterized integral membrane protein
VNSFEWDSHAGAGVALLLTAVVLGGLLLAFLYAISRRP